MPTDCPENTENLSEISCWICNAIPEQDKIMFNLEYGKVKDDTIELITEDHQYFCEKHLGPIDTLMNLMRITHDQNINRIDILPVFEKTEYTLPIALISGHEITNFCRIELPVEDSKPVTMTYVLVTGPGIRRGKQDDHAVYVGIGSPVFVATCGKKCTFNEAKEAFPSLTEKDYRN
jgi:hypothetical protein